MTGTSAYNHLRNLEQVLDRLQSNGVRVKKEKCAFLVDSVEYLGHRVESQGLHATTGKLEAITQAPTPKNVQELRSCLGLINYNAKFIPTLATVMQPLNLLKQGAKWEWSASCTQAFLMAKEKLSSSPVLVHYDPSLPIKMAGDASAYGIGAVISHVYPDGSERAIAASRTLS